MKAIKIDAKERTVELVEIEKGLKPLQEIVGGYIEGALSLSETSDYLYVNEEGLMTNPHYFTFWKEEERIFAGNCVIVGADDTGNDIDVHISAEEVEKKIRFVGRLEAVKLAGEYGL